ncbi:MAG: hypothetical protein VYE15_06675, partial [Myxococcota bacterium]|nr:hypothetical protein [Myxococcota bacterium]
MTRLLPNGRPILAALVCLAMCATGCADAPDGEGDGPVDSCGPLTTRTCDCASGFGPGTSTCLSGGDGWSDCVCLGDASGDAVPGDAGPGSG